MAVLKLAPLAMALLAGGNVNYRHRRVGVKEYRTVNINSIKRPLVFSATFTLVMALTLMALKFNASQVLATTVVSTMIVLGLSKGLGFLRN